MVNASQVTASAAEVIRNFGLWQDRAAESPVHITHHGRRRLVMLSAGDFDAMQAATSNPADHGQGSIDPFFVADRVMAYSDDGFFLVDEQLDTKLINAAGCALLKTSAHEFVGKPLADLVPGLVEDVGFEMARRTLQTGQSARFQVSSPRYPGRVLEFRAIPVHSCVGCVFQDVTASVEEQQAVGRMESLDEAMALLAHVAQARLSARGTFAATDRGLPAMLGLPAQRLIGVRFTDVLVLDDRARVGAVVENVLLDGKARRTDAALLANGGARLPIEVAIAPVRGKDGITGATLLLSGRGGHAGSQDKPVLQRHG